MTDSHLQSEDTRWFYQNLPVLASFEQAADGRNHTSLPDDWIVVVTDVAGSTKAIENGLYKNVNTVGAATIAAVLNVDRSLQIPFVFGGDGATFAIPPCLEHGVRCALLGARKLAQEGFNLDLRIGMVPVKELCDGNDRVAVGRFRQSKQIIQTSLSGFGWNKAEAMMKDPAIRSKIAVTQTAEVLPNADFTGFECRWKPIPARRDHKLAVVVLSTSNNPSEHMDVYRSVLKEITSIYVDESLLHPLDRMTLQLSLNPASVIGEILVRTSGLTVIEKIKYALFAISTLYIGRILMGVGLTAAGVNWGQYRQEVVENADYRKFDGTLKFIIDGTKEQSKALETYLEGQRQSGHLVYGLHDSKAAIITCIVFSHSDNHSHFVDGSDGGYAIAARMLKEQMEQFKKSRRIVE
jgi:hypothetical protein